MFEDASATDTTTVGERRRDIRREQRVKKGRTLSIRLLIIAGLVMLLAVAGVIAYNSEFLAISEVRVNGAEHLSADHLKEVAAVPVGSTLLRVDTEGIKARLEADPWIKQASVERELPATLILNISERRVFAQAEIIPDVTNATITHWLISEDGVWLGTLDGPEETQVLGNLDLKGLVMIKDVSRAVRPQLGAEVKDEGVANALAILAGFSDEMRGLVATISAPDRTRTTLGLLNNVGVAFGAAEDIPAKESAIITLLNAHPDTLTYINVRVPDRATYRAVE
ncbi:MAG: FtsQ-type POTRA domain-containing protein [Coriobacteriales bacterium]|nr:FtsQ-type POTRA domain-containing protein [Coriobacteriales bacterium]